MLDDVSQLETLRIFSCHMSMFLIAPDCVCVCVSWFDVVYVTAAHDNELAYESSTAATLNGAHSNVHNVIIQKMIDLAFYFSLNLMPFIK